MFDRNRKDKRYNRRRGRMMDRILMYISFLIVMLFYKSESICDKKSRGFLYICICKNQIVWYVYVYLLFVSTNNHLLFFTIYICSNFNNVWCYKPLWWCSCVLCSCCWDLQKAFFNRIHLVIIYNSKKHVWKSNLIG